MSGNHAVPVGAELISKFNSRIVTFLVGPQNVRFNVHRDVICQPHTGDLYDKVSVFYEAIQLPEDGPAELQFFVNSLYRFWTAPTGPCFRREDIKVLEIPQKFKLYTFARKYNVVSLKNMIISEVERFSKRVSWKDANIHREDLESLNDRGPHKTGMHFLIEDWLIRDIFRVHSGIDEIKGALKDLPEFLVRAVLEHVLEHPRSVNEDPQIQPKDEEAFLPLGDIPEDEKTEEKLGDEAVDDTDMRSRKRRRH